MEQDFEVEEERDYTAAEVAEATAQLTALFEAANVRHGGPIIYPLSKRRSKRLNHTLQASGKEHPGCSSLLTKHAAALAAVATAAAAAAPDDAAAQLVAHRMQRNYIHRLRTDELIAGDYDREGLKMDRMCEDGVELGLLNHILRLQHVVNVDENNKMQAVLEETAKRHAAAAAAGRPAGAASTAAAGQQQGQQQGGAGQDVHMTDAEHAAAAGAAAAGGSADVQQGRDQQAAAAAAAAGPDSIRLPKLSELVPPYEMFLEDWKLLLPYFRQQREAGWPDPIAAEMHTHAAAWTGGNFEEARAAYRLTHPDPEEQERQREQQRRRKQRPLHEEDWGKTDADFRGEFATRQGLRAFDDSSSEEEEEWEVEWGARKLAAAAARHAAAGRTDAAAIAAAAAERARPVPTAAAAARRGAARSSAAAASAAAAASVGQQRAWGREVVESRRWRKTERPIVKEDIPPINLQLTGDFMVRVEPHSAQEPDLHSCPNCVHAVCFV